MSDYFDESTNRISSNALARSSDINGLRDELGVAFDKLPDPSALSNGVSMYAVDTGTANAYLVSLSAAPSSYDAGLMISMKPSHDNTGASTINVNSLGVKNIKRVQGEALEANDLETTGVYNLVYDGTNFVIIGATTSEMDAAVLSCTTSSSSASTSASNASSSASSASASASSAASSASNASTYQNNASTSASNASDSEDAAALSETAAGNSASSASTSASNALTSANNASTSASNASTSASNASSSATTAGDHADTAELWATEAEDTEVTTGKYSAYHWAQKAEDSTVASTLLTNIKTVDGSGSGLDADLLDGNHASAFATAAQGTKADNALPATSNAVSATKLATARTIGGTAFDGTANITPANATLAATATKLHTARTIDITGDITATAVAFDGSANIAISASVNNDSHSHTASTLTASSETTKGVVELATTTEASDGTDTERAVTPAGVKAFVDANGSSTAVSASKLSTARTIDIDGDITATGVAFDGTADITITAAVNNDSHTHDGRYFTETESDARYISTTGNAASATKLNTARTIDIAGDITATAVPFDGTANISISATVNNDSHTHDTRYFTETESDARYLAANATAASATKLLNARTFDIDGDITATGVSFDGTGDVTITAAVNNDSHTHTTATIANLSGVNTGDQTTITGNAGTATKLATARTIALSGDASGSISFDGSANKTIEVTVANDSHTHTGSTISSASETAKGVVELATTTEAEAGTDTTRAITAAGVKAFVDANGSSTAASATKLTTARTIDIDGDITATGVAFDGTADITITAAVNNDSHTHDTRYYTESEADARFLGITDAVDSATKLETARTIDITGDITATAQPFDGTADISINAVVNNDSHTHDTRYFTETESDARFLGINATSTAATKLLNARTFDIDGDITATGVSFDGTGDVTITAAVNNDSHSHTNTTISNLDAAAIVSGTLSRPTSSSSASCTGNAATATKLVTARTISLGGDASGSASFDGSANVTLTATVANDSHSHSSSTISSITTAVATAAIKEASEGATGTYVFAYNTNNSSADTEFGDTLSGSYLRPAGMRTSSGMLTGSTLSGTWRCMGNSEYVDEGGDLSHLATLWLRIS